jgi:hypothetical protein
LGAQADPQQRQYLSLKAAQTACEINPNCNGVTRSTDSAGNSFYTVRGGTTPISTRPGTSSGTAAADTTIYRETDSSWLKQGVNFGLTVPVGNLSVGTPYSSRDIPRAFSDDYPSTLPTTTPPFQWFSGSFSDLNNTFSPIMLQVASIWSSWQNSVQNTNTYYQLNGITRTIDTSSLPNTVDTGICVGPCDPQHTLHDPIQMIYDSAGNRGI